MFLAEGTDHIMYTLQGLANETIKGFETLTKSQSDTVKAQHGSWLSPVCNVLYLYTFADFCKGNDIMLG